MKYFDIPLYITEYCSIAWPVTAEIQTSAPSNDVLAIVSTAFALFFLMFVFKLTHFHQTCII